MAGRLGTFRLAQLNLTAPALRPSLPLYSVSGSGFARDQYNGSQCLERLKARAALFKCPEISFQGDGLQLP